MSKLDTRAVLNLRGFPQFLFKFNTINLLIYLRYTLTNKLVRFNQIIRQ